MQTSPQIIDVWINPGQQQEQHVYCSCNEDIQTLQIPTSKNSFFRDIPSIVHRSGDVLELDAQSLDLEGYHKELACKIFVDNKLPKISVTQHRLPKAVPKIGRPIHKRCSHSTKDLVPFILYLIPNPIPEQERQGTANFMNDICNRAAICPYQQTTVRMTSRGQRRLVTIQIVPLR